MGELTLTEAQDDGHFAVRIGDEIVITLSESAGAGYQWSAAALDEAYLRVERREYQPRGGGVGSAGSAVWTMRAMREGRTRVELKKSRPWEPSGAAVDRFRCTLEIS